jgi:hypothetical protein
MKKPITSVFNATFLKEMQEIKKAFKYAEKVKSGKMKARPAEELLKELN